MEPIVAGAVAILYLILSAQPTSRVVLLPDADGKTGTLLVKTEGGEQRLSSAYGSASVNTRGALTLQTDDAAQVTQRYATTLDARPAAPVSFLLYFEFGSAVDIAPAFQPVLAQLVAALPAFPAPEITVIGHTDTMGTLESNDLLSLQRAETVRDLLLQAGVRAATLDVSGRGEREPVVPTADEVPEQKNRRVEINLR